MTAKGARVLVVDDEPAICRTLKTNLTGHGFQVNTEATGGAAVESLDRWRPDIILLDLGLPDMDGVDVIREIRKRGATPVIVLSVREEEQDKVAALDVGADDYLTKPFGVDELLARIRVGLRHAAGGAATEPVVRVGGLTVDLERRRVMRDGEDIHLTPTEYDLLKVFVSHPDRVMTDRMLLQQVWGPEYGDEAHYLHVYMARLRRKIETDPQQPRHIVTEPGVGYRFVTEQPIP
jgi:two-component system, OmpR family, KDP operon response regulator KdpE